MDNLKFLVYSLDDMFIYFCSYTINLEVSLTLCFPVKYFQVNETKSQDAIFLFENRSQING